MENGGHKKMKAIPEVDRKAYELAKSYLPSQKITGVTQALIEKYQNQQHVRMIDS